MSKNLICLKHPQYRGKGAPELSCKTCCARYIQTIKSEVENKYAKLTPPKSPR